MLTKHVQSASTMKRPSLQTMGGPGTPGGQESETPRHPTGDPGVDHPAPAAARPTASPGDARTDATANEVAIDFLGPVRIRSASGSTEIKDKKAILLMFLLAVRGASSRQQLASLLWPGTDSERSQGSLRLRLHKINRIHPGMIQSHLTSVFLNPKIRHDIGFLTDNEEIPLSIALDAHRGHLIGSLEFPENPQLNAIIAHYRQQLVAKSAKLLERHAKECADAGDFHQAIYFLSQILLLSPHDESACRQLMRVHVLSGCRAAAIETYESFRRNMRETLGIEPDGRTKRLHMDILMLQHEPDNNASLHAPDTGQA